MYVILAVAAVLTTLGHLRANFRSLPPDLRAFYAAGRVVALDKSSPYLAEPLHRREEEAAKKKLGFVTPAPLPPYDLVALSLVARLPLSWVVVLSALTTLAAGAVTSAIVARWTRLPLAIAVATVFFGTVVSASSLGQLAPIAIASLVVAAWGARARRGAVTAVALVVAAIQPQMAAASIVAALLYVPSTRIFLALGIAFLAIVPTFVMGFASWSDYIRTLGLHAFAELHFPGQYSLSWLLGALHVPSRLSLTLGSASTLILVCLALLLIARERERAVSSGAVIVLPAVFSLIAGTFIHEYQIAFVVIAVVLCVRPQPHLLDATWSVGSVLVPFAVFISFADSWPHGSAWGTVCVRLAALWALMFALNVRFGERFAAWKSSLATAFWLILFVVLAKLRPRYHFETSAAALTQAIHGTQNASIGWANVSDAEGATFGHAPYLVAVKSVIWIALIVGAAAVARGMFPRFDQPHASGATASPVSKVDSSPDL